MMKQARSILVLLAAIIGTGAAVPGGDGVAGAAGSGTELRFTDAARQSREFIGYFHTVTLTREQQKMKERVLSKIPAPCCSNYSVLTCCCPCNLAKSVWGLSNHAIAHLGYDEGQLRSAVLGWLGFVGPAGFTGNACYTGRCEQPFDRNGCGGMQERGLRAAS